MPTANLSDIAEPTPATGGHANLSDIEGPAQPEEKAGYFGELYRQLIADPFKAFKADPIGTLAHLIGSAGGIATGTTPVPGPGGQIQIAGPTQQMQGVADIAERGPAAIGAAATIGALPIAARYAGPLVSAGAGKLANVVPSNATADVVGLVSPRVANAIRVANRVKRGVEAFRKEPGNASGPAPETIAPPAGRIPPIVPPEIAPAETPPPVETPTTPTAPEVSPELQKMRDDIAKAHDYKDFASVKNPAHRATIEDLANRLNSGAPATPAATPGPQLVPKTTPSGQDIIRGSSNIPLSRQGYAEAHRLASATAGQWDEIHTSPLDRAQTTAQIVADVNPQAGPVKPTEALTPWYLGQHEGQPTTAVLDKMQQLIEKPDEVPTGRGPQSTQPGQSFNDFKDEFLGHVQNQVKNYQEGQKILNATHYRDTRVLQAWAKAGAPDDLSIDVPTMMEKGNVKPGDMLRLDPKTMQVTTVKDASQLGIYFARHGATEWNAENGTVNPTESAGAPGPRGPASAPPTPAAAPPPAPQVPPEVLARLNAGAAPEAPAAPPIKPSEPFKQAARTARAANADALAQGLQASGISADVADNIPRFRWRDLARKHGVDWPATQEAQFNLIRDTRAALRGRQTK